MIFHNDILVACMYSRDIYIPERYQVKRIVRKLKMIYVEEISNDLKKDLEKFYFPTIELAD